MQESAYACSENGKNGCKSPLGSKGPVIAKKTRTDADPKKEIKTLLHHS
jgi:hypothetical protein